MTIRLRFDRIPPGLEIGPHRHGVETIVYLAAGELVFEHGEALERRIVVRAGDVLYEAPADRHLVRNEGRIDALALLATSDPDPRRPRAALRRWTAMAEPVARAGRRPATEQDGVRRSLLVAPGEFRHETFTVTELELAPGAVDEWHRHHEAEHALVVLAGRGLVQVGQVEEVLQPLTGIRIERGLPHRIENAARTPLRLFVCASPGTDPVVDRESAEAPHRRSA